MKIIFISWWQIYIFLTAILLAIGFFVFNFVKKSREDIRSRFYREVKEAEREIEDVMELEKKIGEKKDLEEEARKQRERLLEKLKGEKEQNTNNNQY